MHASSFAQSNAGSSPQMEYNMSTFQNRNSPFQNDAQVQYVERPSFTPSLSRRGGDTTAYTTSSFASAVPDAHAPTQTHFLQHAQNNPRLFPDHKLPQRPNPNATFKSMSGETLYASEFTHNNMVPFFGGNVHQNVSPHAGAMRLEMHTGVSPVQSHKEPIAPLFSPSDDVTYVHGTPSMTNEMRETRFYESKYKQNEKPMPEINVGPGLDAGFTSKPSGGFQQADGRAYAMPKTVDELRTRTNPKVTYTEPVIRGNALNTKRGEEGVVSKNKPDSFYVNSPARYNTTVGLVKGRRLRTKPVDRATHRQSTLREHTGNAGRFTHEAGRPDEHIRTENPFKTETDLESAGIRNANNNGKWYDINAFTGDYGKKGIEVLPNERDTTQLASYVSNVNSFMKAMIAPVVDVMKTTRKENVIGNPRVSGNMGNNVKKQPAYDPNEIAKTTLKETNIHNTRTGNMGSGTRHVSTVYDPNDVARTTIKETNIHDNRTGNLKGPTKLATYDPNDVARTTIKETNIHDNRTGNINDLSRHAPPVYDPNDVARTTLKETNIHDTRTGNIGDSVRLAPHVYDPNDVAKTTIKETNIHDNRTGNINDLSRHALPVYDPNDVTRTTIKETNIHDNRTGNVEMRVQKLPVYDPNDIAKTTIKETNIHDSRLGYMSATPAGDGGGSHQQGVLHHADNAKTTVRETVEPESTVVNAKGRNKPTVYDPNDVARTTIKETNIDNVRQGNVTGLDTHGGYTTNPKEAPNTNRQFTADVEYSGVADGPDEGGYQVAEVVAPATQRHEISDNDYAGNANSASKAPMSYEDIYNATMDEVKEKVAEGRQPTLSSSKAYADKTFVKMEQKDDADRRNQRDTVSTRVVEQLPADISTCSITKDKINIELEPERNQPDPSLVSAFKENPYTHPLDTSV